MKKKIQKDKKHIHKWFYIRYHDFYFRKCKCGRLEGYGFDETWSLVAE